jgi:hypothetical protein
MENNQEFEENDKLKKNFETLVTERFNTVISMLGGSLSDISLKFKVNYSTLSKWANGSRVPPPRKLRDIFGVNPAFILNGEHPVFLSESNKLEQNAETIEPSLRDDIEVEFIPIPANYGVGYTFNDMPTKTVVKDVKKSYKKTYKQVRGFGDSMFPAIPDGWYVTFDTSLTPKHNDVVVATANGVLVVKRFQIIDGHKSLVSDNPAYEKYNFNGGDDVIIHGVVIEISKY